MAIAGAAAAEDFFKDKLQPFLAKHCYDCHGAEEPEADLALASYADLATLRRDHQKWGRVVEFLEAGLMPPDDMPRPDPDEVNAITDWLSDQLARIEPGGPRNPGRVTMRRLNRAEYDNTIRDLVGIETRFSEEFPSDDVGYGFDNIGDVLTLPPLLMERYLSAAERIAEAAIVVRKSSEPEVTRYGAAQLRTRFSGEDREEATAGSLYRNGEVFVEHDFRVDGEYLVRARAYADQAGPDPARMALRVGRRRQGNAIDVTAVEAKPEVYETRVPMRAGQRRVSAEFLNDYWRPDDPDPANRDRNLYVEYMEIVGPLSGERQVPESHRQIIFRQPTDEADVDRCTAEILARFARRAYRRPPTEDEVARLVKLASIAREDGGTFEAGIQLAVQAVLVSPNFLFRVELDAASGGDAKVERIDEHQLASRLSYFLWSSMPDDELLDLADAGRLSQPDVLEAQVRRMLADEKSQALVENFAGQWLQTRNLSLAAPDRRRFRSFNEDLRRAMQRETEMFFASVLREDRSLLDFLDARDTFLNERLAKHYGINDVSGDEFRRVTLPDDRRGGLLTQASILTITSNPTRTSPVKRGKWIMEQILGTPPPPPPPGVPELEQGRLAEGTLRQRMEQHRENPSCAVCHNRMDALGFAFENFDAIGVWRDRERDQPIDPSGTLPGGREFAGPAELRALLKENPEPFVRNLARKMLTYAVGRGLESYDNQAVGEIVERVAADDYKFSALVLAVVASEPFQMRRARGDDG